MSEILHVKAKLDLTITVPSDRPDLVEEANRIIDSIIPVAIRKLEEVADETDGFDFSVDYVG